MDVAVRVTVSAHFWQSFLRLIRREIPKSKGFEQLYIKVQQQFSISSQFTES